MHRTSNAFSVLQATAATVGLAILLWSFGLPSLRFAEAANVTSFSDKLSDSAPGVVSNHTIKFTTPSGIAAGQSIVLTFPNGAFDFNLAGIGAEDIDLASTTGDYSLQNGAGSGQTWGVATSTFSITLTSVAAVLTPNATVTIEIGTHALFGGGSQSQIVNPNDSTSYEIDVAAGSLDSGETRVAIVENVLVSASVDTVFTFTVEGVVGGQAANSETTGGTTTATTIPFGTLTSGNASTAAQDLTVVTNARSGFVVTVQTDQQLLSSNGSDIDGFADGAYNATPIPWDAPGALPVDEDTYGHWGIITDDASIGANLFRVGLGGNRFVSASTTPVEIFNHDGPTDGTGNGEGTTRVGYKVEVSALQEAAEDYQATLTYVATPVF